MIQRSSQRWGRAPVGNKWTAHLRRCFELIPNQARKKQDGQKCLIHPVIVKWTSSAQLMRQSQLVRIFNISVLLLATIYIHNTCSLVQSCTTSSLISHSESHGLSQLGGRLFIQRRFAVFLSFSKIWDSTSNFITSAFTQIFLNSQPILSLTQFTCDEINHK
jgi:hypothetical protein